MNYAFFGVSNLLSNNVTAFVFRQDQRLSVSYHSANVFLSFRPVRTKGYKSMGWFRVDRTLKLMRTTNEMFTGSFHFPHHRSSRAFNCVSRPWKGILVWTISGALLRQAQIKIAAIFISSFSGNHGGAICAARIPHSASFECDKSIPYFSIINGHINEPLHRYNLFVNLIGSFKNRIQKQSIGTLL